MHRVAVLTVSLVSAIALSNPQFVNAEPQRGHARSRGGSSAASAPVRSARPAQARGSSRGTSRRSPAGSPRRIGSSKSGQSGGQRQTGRVGSGGVVASPQKARGTAARTNPGRSRVTEVRSSGPATTSTIGRSGTQRQVGRVRSRGTTASSVAGTVTTVGSKPSRSRIVTVRQPGTSAASPAQSDRRSAVTNGRRVVRGSSRTGGFGRRVGDTNRGAAGASRRPPGDSSIVGRAVPRHSRPLVASPHYGGGSRQGGIRTSRHYGQGSYYNRGYGRGSYYNRGYGRGYRGRHGGGNFYRHVYRPSFYYPSIYGSFFYLPGYSFGVGLGSGYGHNWGNYGYGYGHGYSGYAYYPYGHLSYASSPSYADPYTGFMRLKVRPRDAEVFVNGYYVGVVNEFDGIFQRLRLEEGTHHIEIRHPAYFPLELEVLIVTGEKVTYEGHLEPR